MTTSMKSIKLTVFLLRMMGLWYTSGKIEKFLSNISLTVVFSLMMYSVFQQGQELYHSGGSIKMITFAAPVATVVLTETSKLIVFMVKRKKVAKLNKFVDHDFWKRSYTDKEEQIFNDCDVFCFRSISLCLSLMLGTSTHYLVLPGIMRNDTSRREFPFPVKIETTILYESPFYEMYFTLEVLGTSMSYFTVLRQLIEK